MDDRITAVVAFPGGYIVEVHSLAHPLAHSQSRLAPGVPSRTPQAVLRAGLGF